VEGAGTAIGDRLPVVVTGALQNPSGRMVFARLEKESAVPRSAKANRPPRGNSGSKGNERPPANPR
jgi:hypothetical protein